MKKLLIIPLALLVAACQSTQPELITTKSRVIIPDNSMYNCPTLAQFPSPETLTDVQVAQTIVQLYQNNTTCKNSMDAIKKYLERAKATVEK